MNHFLNLAHTGRSPEITFLRISVCVCVCTSTLKVVMGGTEIFCLGNCKTKHSSIAVYYHTVIFANILW